MSVKIENAFAAIILSRIAELDYFHDLTLIAGKDGQSFGVHRVVIASSNNYFSALLGPSFKESNENKIVLVNIDGSALKLIINYCYTGNIEISDENVDIILAAASSMEFVEIEQKCCQHLLNRITVENCVHHFMCADKFNLPELRKRSFDEIVKMFSELLIQSVEHFFKKYNYQELVLNEYRNRAVNRKPTHKKRSEFLNVNKREGKDFLNIKRYVFKDNKWYKYLSLPLNSLNSDFFFSKIYYHILHYENKIYLIGDLRGPQNPLLRIELTSMEQTNMPAMNEYRNGFGSIAVEGKIYVFGGFNGNEHLASCECFDTKLLKWENIEPMSTPRVKATVALLNGDIYVAGGHSKSEYLSIVECYSPKTNKWTRIASMNEKRYLSHLIELNGYLYAFGSDRTAARYNLKDNIWTTIGSFGNAYDIDSLFPNSNDIYVISTNGQFMKCSPNDDSTVVECARFFDENNRCCAPILYK